MLPQNDKKIEDDDAIYKRRRKISYLEEVSIIVYNNIPVKACETRTAL